MVIMSVCLCVSSTHPSACSKQQSLHAYTLAPTQVADASVAEDTTSLHHGTINQIATVTGHADVLLLLTLTLLV